MTITALVVALACFLFVMGLLLSAFYRTDSGMKDETSRGNLDWRDKYRNEA